METKNYIPEIYLDWSFNEDERKLYRFEVKRSEHSFSLGDRVELCVVGRPDCYLGTIEGLEEDGIIIQTDDSIDLSESYSIKLVKR